MPENTLPYWIGFSKVPGIGPARLRKLLDYYGDIKNAWHANPGELRAIGLDKRSVESLVKVRNRVDLDREVSRLKQSGHRGFDLGQPSLSGAAEIDIRSAGRPVCSR